jgi:PadR family transcriptional regulator AphA
VSALVAGFRRGLVVHYSIMEYTPRSRGLAVEFAVLGYLIETPMHGYELRDRLARGIGAFWRIASSQLYQVLHRLEEGGWVECAVEARSSGPSRNVYRISAKGKDAFWNWAASPVRHVREIRVEFLAKVYFLRRLAPDRLAGLIAGQIAALQELYEHLSEQPRVETDDAGLGRLAASYRRSQVAGTMRWVEENERELLVGKEGACTG